MFPNPHPPGCPWHDLAEQLGAPNVKWCEPTLCAVISEPANTWSNLSYLLVVAPCLWMWRKAPNPALRYYALVVGLMGLASFVYHASNIFPTQVLDFVGMFLFVYLVLVLNLRRLGIVSRVRARAVYWLLVALSTAAVWVMYVAAFKFQIIIGAVALAIVGTEIALARNRETRAPRYLYFALGLGLLALAALCSLADVTRFWCAPDNAFLHGHALWHLGSGIATLFVFLHYRAIELD